MIDFPASPTDGQIFSATNGVVYKYSATYSSWLAQNPTPPIGGTGDFCAQQNLGGVLGGAAATIIWSSVQTGNSGGWLNLSNGRYTPPAGRFCIISNVSGNLTAAATSLVLMLRKNGTIIAQNTDTAAAANQWSTTGVQVTADANGTDWFDVQGIASAGVTNATGQFLAFPLTGMQGPTGGAPGPVVGDFFAAGSGGSLNTSVLTAITPPVVTGNSGSYYNAANGRWTPPSGRYSVFGWVDTAGTSAAGVIAVALFKNGSQFSNVRADGYPGAATGPASPYVQAIVDANGSDYFELRGFCATANTITNAAFGATPTQGMVGPQGPPGVISNGYRLISRVVPTAGLATVDFTNLPSDINDLQCTFDLAPTTNDAGLLLQFYNSVGVLDASAAYNWSTTASTSQAAAGSAPLIQSNASTTVTTAIALNYVSTTNQVANLATIASAGIRGDLTVPNIRDAGRAKSVNFRAAYINGGTTATFGIVGMGHRTVVGAITGFRFSFSPGTIAAGGAVSLWGSP
jgi:hypothetical protein